MSNEDIALTLVQAWLSQSQDNKSVKEISQAYIEFLLTAEHKEVKD